MRNCIAFSLISLLCQILDAKNLSSRPWETVATVEKFLGVPPMVGFKDEFFYNETKNFYCFKATGCLPSTKGRTHPEVPVHLEARLRRYYAPYNHVLYALVGHNFGWKDDILSV